MIAVRMVTAAIRRELDETRRDFRAALSRHRARVGAVVERHAPLVPAGHPWAEPGRANEWAARAAEQDEARARRDASTRGGDCE